MAGSPSARADVHVEAVRRREPAMVRLGHFFFRTRDLLFPAVLLLLGFGIRQRILAGDMRLDHLLDAAGLAVALSGQALRALVIGLVYITRGGQNRRIWASTLVEGGIFSHCRNPLYLGNLLIVLGLVIIHNSAWLYALALPFFVVAYVSIVAAEEEYLSQSFGAAYQDYCRRVPRWMPRLTGLRETLATGRFDWLKVVRKEYGTPFAWMSGALLLLILEHRSLSAPPISRLELGGIAVTWVVLAAMYLTARVMKLRGLLGSG